MIALVQTPSGGNVHAVEHRAIGLPAVDDHHEKPLFFEGNHVH